MYIRGSELFHYGVKGMHWGVRRYQNADGSYTAAGKEHYGIKDTIKNAAKKVTDATVYGKGGKVAKAVSKANYSMVGGAKKVSQVTGKVSDTASNIKSKVSDTASNASSSVKTLINNASSTASNSLNNLTSNGAANSAKTFVNSVKDTVIDTRNSVNSKVSTKIHQAQVKRKNS